MKNFGKYILTSSLSMALSLTLITNSSAQEIKISGMAYSVGLDYSNSAIKKDGYVYGIYGYMGIGYYHVLEVGLEHTFINYKGTSDDLDQNDLTFVYTNYSFPNTKIRMGFHYIDSDDKLTDGGYTIILSGGTYQPYKWDANLDFYYTHYKDYELKDGSKGLDVYQFSPNIGFNWGNYYTFGSFYFKTTATYIRHSDDVGFGKNFLSLEERISYFKGLFSASVFGWLGERSFFVDNGGFTIFNLKEKYKDGYGASISFTIMPNLRLTAMATKQKFREVDNPKDVDIYTYGIQLGANF